MKREDVLKFLTAIFSTILIHDALISELSAIIERSGFEKKFFKMLGTFEVPGRIRDICDQLS